MSHSNENSLIGGLTRGVAAGAIGTAVMTGAQTAYYKAVGAEPSTTPAEVGQRVARGVLKRPVPEDQTGTLNNVMHWLYGTGWGALFGLTAAGREPGLGLGFAVTVWGASQVELPAMKLAPPIWENPDPKTLAPDIGFHLVYGVAVATAYKALS